MSVEILENGQSYADKVQAHVESAYSGTLTLPQVETIDTTCGATFGAKTVKEIIKVAFEDYKNIKSSKEGAE